MTSAFLDEVRQVTKHFFVLRLEEKQKYSRAIHGVDGYRNDAIVSEHQTLDWTDRPYLTLYPIDEPNSSFGPMSPLNSDGGILAGKLYMNTLRNLG